MPREISDSASRKKDKLSSRDKDYGKAYDEFYKRKSVGKSSDDRTPLKRGVASGQSSGQKRLFLEREENCFASEYDDYDDSKKFVRNSVLPHSRNGLLLPGISAKHALVDYDDESDSDSSSESFAPEYPTGKGARRKSAVQVVSASVKADLNELRQQSHQQSDSTISQHVRLPSTNSSKNKTESVSSDDRSDKKKHRHSVAELPEPVCKTKDIPVDSPKRQHSKEHHGSRKYADEEHDLPADQINGKKTHSADRPEKTSALKSGSKEKDTKHAKRRDSETEIVSTNIQCEKSKAHKKSKKHELNKEQLAEDKGMEQRSRTSAAKLSSTSAAGYKEEKSEKVSEDSFSHSKTNENTDRPKRTSKHLDTINEAKSLSHGSSSVQQEDRVVKLSSDDHVVHKKREKEKSSSRKKSHAAEDSVSDKGKEKKDRSASKRDTLSSSSKADEVKDRRSKDKKSQHSRKEREFSDEGQISSDSSMGHVKESKHKHQSNGSLRNQSSTPVKSSKNISSSSSSSQKAVLSDVCLPER